MDFVKLTTKVDEHGCLNLNIPTQLAGTEVNVVVFVNLVTPIKPTSSTYDFSDLVGRLNWRGDAVAMQRHLRKE